MDRTKLYQAGGANYCVLPAFLYDDVKTTSLEKCSIGLHIEIMCSSPILEDASNYIKTNY